MYDEVKEDTFNVSSVRDRFKQNEKEKHINLFGSSGLLEILCFIPLLPTLARYT